MEASDSLEAVVPVPNYMVHIPLGSSFLDKLELQYLNLIYNFAMNILN